MLELLTLSIVGTALGRAIGRGTDWEATNAYIGLFVAIALAIKMGMQEDVAIMGGAAMLVGFRWARGWE